VATLGCDITGITLTRFTLNPSTLDWLFSGAQDMSDPTGGSHTITAAHPAGVASYLWTDVPNNPAYSNRLEGVSMGQGYMEHCYNTLVEGSITRVDFGVMAKSNKIICPTILSAPPTASGFGCEQNVIEAGYDRWTQTAWPFVNHTF
jgi:hypothetical protein